MLDKIICELKDLGHKSNTFADKKHENLTKTILLNNGLKEIKKIKVPSKKDSEEIKEQFRIQEILRDKDNKLETIKELKSQYFFIEQPNGSQDSPDFIACIDGVILWIECKSSDNGMVSWNSGMPRINVLYIYSCKKTNKTTLFFGQDTNIYIETPNFENEYDTFDTENKNNTSTDFDKKFPSKNFSYYNRRMLVDNTKYNNENLRQEFFIKVKDNLLERH